MSEWSLVSGNSSKASELLSDRSEDDFMILKPGPQATVLAEDPLDSYVQVNEWLGSQCRNGAISITEDLILTPSNGIWRFVAESKKGESEKLGMTALETATSYLQLGNTNRDLGEDVKTRKQETKMLEDTGDMSQTGAAAQQPTATHDTTPKAWVPEIKVYSIKISDLPKAPSTRKSAYFSISKHPSTWYSAVAGKGSHSSLSSGIFTSIERVLKNHGRKGMLHVILWANVFNTTKGQQEFWKDLGEAALRRLPKEDALVLVTGFTRSIQSRAGPRLAKKYDLKTFFGRHSFYFAVKQSTGFAWMSTEEAESFRFGKIAK